jgi:hypothetical protein
MPYYEEYNKMKLCLLTSNHLRHKYMARELSRKHDLGLIIAEDKGNQNQYKGETLEDDELLQDHFDKREGMEKSFFDGSRFPSSKVVEVPRGEINSSDIVKILRDYAPEGVAVFGTGILKPDIFEACNCKFVNAHQGLSPYYRGSGTNFFPFVNDELQYFGVTMHYIDKGIDTGNIIYHWRPSLKDWQEIIRVWHANPMHAMGCWAIMFSCTGMSNIFTLLEKEHSLPGINQWDDKYRYYQRKDFNAAAVRKARENIENGMIEKYISRHSDLKGLRTIELS